MLFSDVTSSYNKDAVYEVKDNAVYNKDNPDEIVSSQDPKAYYIVQPKIE